MEERITHAIAQVATEEILERRSNLKRQQQWSTHRENPSRQQACRGSFDVVLTIHSPRVVFT